MRAALGRDPGVDVEMASKTFWEMHGVLTASGFVPKTDGVLGSG